MDDKINFRDMTSLYQYDLDEILTGSIEDIISRLQDLQKSEPGYNMFVKPHIYDDSFGGLNKEFEFYGELKDGWEVVYPENFNKYGMKIGEAKEILTNK